MSIIFLQWFILTPSKIHIEKKSQTKSHNDYRASHHLCHWRTFFSFLEREMPSTYANEIKLRTLFFFKFSPKYVFLCRSNLFVLDILFNRQMFCWWFILNNSTFYEFVLIFLFPGMDLSILWFFFLMCTIVFFIYMLNSKDDKNSKCTLMIDRCNIRRHYNG